jgi:hypothetical protein
VKSWLVSTEWARTVAMLIVDAFESSRCTPGRPSPAAGEGPDERPGLSDGEFMLVVGDGRAEAGVEAGSLAP